MQDEDPVIHLVRHGWTLCNIETRDMNKKHRWVELYGIDFDFANCEGCLNEKKYRDLKARGLSPKRVKG